MGMKEQMTCGIAALAALALTANGLGEPPDDLQARLAELEAKSARDDHRIAELESRLESLETSGSDGWLTERRADEIRHLVEDVLADADTRASLLGGMTAGYDDGAVIASSDGNWLLRTNFQMQQRLVFNRQSDSPSGDNSRWGFEVARAKFIMSGHVVSPEWFYKVEVELSEVNDDLPNGQTRTGLGDAYAGYDFGNGWRIGAGIFKTPLLREELVDSPYQLAVERSYVNYLYTGARTTGFAAHYQGEKLQFTGSINNGISDGVYGGSIVTGPGSAVTAETADFAVSARGEWLIEGTWDPFYDFTSPKGSKRAMMVGGALHFQDSDEDLLALTADFSGEFDGWNVFGALIYTNADTAAGPTANTIAIVAQGGLYLTDEWEGFARFEYSDLDDLASDDVGILTLGATRYFADHHAKWTTDVGIAFDNVPVTVPIADYRADAPGEDGQVVIRSQLQILF
jgi:hypothetical protein